MPLRRRIGRGPLEGVLRLGVTLLAAGGLSAAASAATAVVEPHPATRCLSVEQGAPELPVYPALALARGDSGRVLVELTFTRADARPRVRVVDAANADPAFEEAVVEHARQMRAPCLSAEDGPLQVRRAYNFRPDGGPVRWFRDESASSMDAARVQCVAHVSGAKRPTYPDAAARAGLVGRVIAETRFDGPDRPPHVKVHARPHRQALVRTVVEWSEGLRMPCHTGEAPVHTTWTYVFSLDRETYGFKGVDLLQLLPAVKDIRKQTLQLNTGLMKCPFEVSFQYRQPALPNRVGEVGDSVVDRTPLLTWLERIELQGTAPQLDALFGDTVRLVVPCANIDLKPKE